MANAWIEYIKKIAKETGKSYKEAMSIASNRKKKGDKCETKAKKSSKRKSKKNKTVKKRKNKSTKRR
jgi:hypothetical protein